MHLGAERVCDRLRLAGGNLNLVPRGGQVAEDDSLVANILEKRSANDGNANGFGFLILDVEDSLRGVAVDELHAENLGLREFGLDLDVQVGRLRLSSFGGLGLCVVDGIGLVGRKSVW